MFDDVSFRYGPNLAGVFDPSFVVAAGKTAHSSVRLGQARARRRGWRAASTTSRAAVYASAA